MQLATCDTTANYTGSPDQSPTQTTATDEEIHFIERPAPAEYHTALKSLNTGLSRGHAHFLQSLDLEQDQIVALHAIGAVASEYKYSHEVYAACRIAHSSSLALAIELSKRYPGGLSSLCRASDIVEVVVDREKKFSSYLQRIFSACPQPKTGFNNLNYLKLETNPEELTQVYERYGSLALLVVNQLGHNWISEEVKYRSYLQRISSSCYTHKWYRRNQFPVQLFKRYPEEVTQLFEKFDNFTLILSDKYGKSLLNAAKSELSTWEKLHKVAGNCTDVDLTMSALNKPNRSFAIFLYSKYGQCFDSLYRFLGFRKQTNEKIYGPFIERITASIDKSYQREIFKYLPLKYLKHEPEKLACMFERYGDHTLSLIRFLKKQRPWYCFSTAEIFAQEEKFRDLFATLRESDEIDRQYFPGRLVDRHGNNPWLFDALDPKLFKKNLGAVEEIVKLTGKGSACVLKHLYYDRKRDKLDYHLKLARHYGQLTGGILEFCTYYRSKNPRTVENLNRIKLQQLIQQLRHHETPEELIGAAIGCLTPKLLQENLNVVTELSRYCLKENSSYNKKYFKDLMCYLDRNPIVIEQAEQTLLLIASITGLYTANAVQAIPLDVLNENPRLIDQIALAMRESPFELHDVYEHLPLDAAINHPNSVLGIVQKYQSHASALFQQFGDHVVTEVEERIYDIDLFIESMGEGARDFLATVNQNSWNTSWSQRQINNFSTATGKVLSHQDLLVKIKDPNIRELAQINKDRFGIVNLQRYLLHQNGEALLRENVKNLNPDYLPDRPIVLFTSAVSDHNGALENMLCDTLIKVSQHCRLFVTETATQDDLIIQALQASSIFGVHNHNQPHKPLHAVFISSHANSLSIKFSELSARTFSYEYPLDTQTDHGAVTVLDNEFYQTLGPLIETDGYLGILGCNPATRMQGLDSVVDVAAKQMSHVNVVGLDQVMISSSEKPNFQISFSEQGQIDPENSHINSRSFSQLTYRLRTRESQLYY